MTKAVGYDEFGGIEVLRVDEIDRPVPRDKKVLVRVKRQASTPVRQPSTMAGHVEHRAHARNSIRGFLHWCIANELTRRFRLHTVMIGPATPMPQQQRIDLLGRLLTDPDQPLRSRVAAAIVLLYAQPVSRIVRLTLDDVIHDSDTIL